MLKSILDEVYPIKVVVPDKQYKGHLWLHWLSIYMERHSLGVIGKFKGNAQTLLVEWVLHPDMG